MEELIRYLEEQYTISREDLLMGDEDRYMLIGQLELLAQIKDIYEKGYPNNVDN